MRTEDKRTIFKMAWEMVKSTGKTFAVALCKAWEVFKMRIQMLEGVVRFAFEKKDGSLRIANGTLRNLPFNAVKGTGKKNYKSIAYFDTDSNAFRSFRVESLIKIY